MRAILRGLVHHLLAHPLLVLVPPLGRRLHDATAPPPTLPPVELPHLWYEDEDGTRIAGPYEHPNGEPFVPREAYLQVSRFVVVRTHAFRFVAPREVEECPHPPEDVCATYGWIEGREGRKCNRCGGTQTRATGEFWPDDWEAPTARELFASEAGGFDVLATALVRDGWTVRQALHYASVACERCANHAGHALGLPGFYGPDSRESKQANTSCELCSPRVERAGTPDVPPLQRARRAAEALR